MMSVKAVSLELPPGLVDPEIKVLKKDEYGDILVSPKMVDKKLAAPHDIKEIGYGVSRQMKDKGVWVFSSGGEVEISSKELENIVLKQLDNFNGDIDAMTIDKRIETGMKMCANQTQKGIKEFMGGDVVVKRGFVSRVGLLKGVSQLGDLELNLAVDSLLDNLCGLEDSIVSVLGYVWIPETVARSFASYLVAFLRGVGGITWSVIRSVFSFLWDNTLLILVFLTVFSSINHLFAPLESTLEKFRMTKVVGFFNNYPGYYASQMVDWSKIAINSSVLLAQKGVDWMGIVRDSSKKLQEFDVFDVFGRGDLKMFGMDDLVGEKDDIFPDDRGKVIDIYSLTEWISLVFLVISLGYMSYDLGSKVWKNTKATNIMCRRNVL